MWFMATRPDHSFKQTPDGRFSQLTAPGRFKPQKTSDPNGTSLSSRLAKHDWCQYAWIAARNWNASG